MPAGEGSSVDLPSGGDELDLATIGGFEPDPLAAIGHDKALPEVRTQRSSTCQSAGVRAIERQRSLEGIGHHLPGEIVDCLPVESPVWFRPEESHRDENGTPLVPVATKPYTPRSLMWAARSSPC